MCVRESVCVFEGRGSTVDSLYSCGTKQGQGTGSRVEGRGTANALVS